VATRRDPGASETVCARDPSREGRGQETETANDEAEVGPGGGPSLATSRSPSGGAESNARGSGHAVVAEVMERVWRTVKCEKRGMLFARPSWESSLLGAADAKFSAEKRRRQKIRPREAVAVRPLSLPWAAP